MKLPEYVPKDEVKRECKELGIRNWAALKKLVPSLEEAKIIRAAIGAAGIRIGIEAFRDGLEVELEHGTRGSVAKMVVSQSFSKSGTMHGF